mgnify:CR=1 FL=1
MADIKYKTGDLVMIADELVGIIIDTVSAKDYLAIDEDDSLKTLTDHYSNIIMYKVLVHSTISLMTESNIKGLVQCAIKQKEK